jgi:hypothetical protein
VLELWVKDKAEIGKAESRNGGRGRNIEARKFAEQFFNPNGIV